MTTPEQRPQDRADGPARPPGGIESPGDAGSTQERLRALLGGAELAPLRQRLRRLYAQAEPGSAPGSGPGLVRLAGLAAHEAERLQSLSGRAPRRSASMQIDLAAIDERLRAAGLAAGLRQALEALDGPIATRHEREAAAAAWAALAQAAPHAALRSLLAEPRALGLLKRLAGGDISLAAALCEHTAIVLLALPAGGAPRARLAAQCLGDAHALDDGRPVATLVLAALRRQAAADDDADIESTRSLWARQGVGVNELARPALTLNLPWPGAAASTGEPQYWSLRRLLRRPPAWAVAGREVFVCENPNLLALAADACGARCAPLVCTDGMPAAAQRSLLQQLRAAGAHLRYHGDFDWPGIAIGNQLMRQLGAAAWRFGSDDYRAALADPARERATLQGEPVAAAWDAALAPAMAAAGCALPEEAVFETLRADLER
ncbi:MAG: TIGR02679 family protein [Proteobacteria bacterium]|nr:TIGR02679 family protein [Pseudomonadota bacterium]